MLLSLKVFNMKKYLLPIMFLGASLHAMEQQQTPEQMINAASVEWRDRLTAARLNPDFFDKRSVRTIGTTTFYSIASALLLIDWREFLGESIGFLSLGVFLDRASTKLERIDQWYQDGALRFVEQYPDLDAAQLTL